MRETYASMIVALVLAAAMLAGCGDDGGTTMDQALRSRMSEAGVTPLDPGEPPEAAKVALGRMLMFDKELSGNRDISCATCHEGSLLTDQKAHNVCVPQIGPGRGDFAPRDVGRYAVTGDDADHYAFRTPPLRNVALTGPWMHDGAFTTLRGAVRHLLDPVTSLRSYDTGQLDPDLRATFQGDEETLEAMFETLDAEVRTPRSLSEGEVDDLIAFLEALTDSAALDLSADIPDSVPSGLPVED